MKSKLPLIIFCLFNVFVRTNTLAQNCPCSGSSNPCASDATTLLGFLTPGSPTYVSSGTINICGIINLGELVPNGQSVPYDLFPMVVPPFVKIIGNYDFFNYNHGGTTINFPFLFALGKKCGTQTADDLPPEGGEPDDEEAIAAQNNSGSLPAPLTSATDDYVFVFKLMEGLSYIICA